MNDNKLIKRLKEAVMLSSDIDRALTQELFSLIKQYQLYDEVSRYAGYIEVNFLPYKNSGFSSITEAVQCLRKHTRRYLKDN